MIIIPFNIRTSRIQDIEIEEGTTLGMLARILLNGGCDIDGATVVVHCGKTGNKISGADDYVLQEGDSVEFVKHVCDTAAIDGELAKACSPSAPEEKPCGCKHGSQGVNVTRSENEIRISIEI